MIHETEMRRRVIHFTRASVTIIVHVTLAMYVAAQSGRPDDTKTTVKSPSRAGRGGRGKEDKVKPKNESPPLANVIVKIRPFGSIVVLDTNSISPDPGTGTIELSDLRVGAHTIFVRSAGYREQARTFELKPGVNEPVEISLERLPAVLNIALALDDAQIEVRRSGASTSLERHTGPIRDLALQPGKYDVTVSRDAYQTERRTIDLEAGQVVYLEVTLEPVPQSEANSAPTIHRIDSVPSSSLVRVEGKDLLVTVVGTTGSGSPSAGTVNVAVTKDSNVAEINGSLTGYPCRVEFVRLENVAASSVAEAPGPSNQWSRVVIRVRPKDVKRVIRFNINWRLVSTGSGSGETP
jgi:hypothetical protein